MRNITNGQRVAGCGCHYDIKTGFITHFCPSLEGCQFQQEREAVVRQALAAPMMGHLFQVKVNNV